MIDWVAIGAVATGGAAVATAFAAGFSALMAKQTKKSAVATQRSLRQSAVELKLIDKQTSVITEQARLVRLALTRAGMPLLIPVACEKQAVQASAHPVANMSFVTLRALGDTTTEWLADLRGSWILPVDDRSSVWVIIEIRNVGTGLALVSKPVVDLNPGSLGGKFLSETISDLLQTPASKVLWPQQAVIPSGESTRFVGRINDPEKVMQYGAASHVHLDNPSLEEASSFTPAPSPNPQILLSDLAFSGA